MGMGRDFVILKEFKNFLKAEKEYLLANGWEEIIIPKCIKWVAPKNLPKEDTCNRSGNMLLLQTEAIMVQRDYDLQKYGDQ